LVSGYIFISTDLEAALEVAEEVSKIDGVGNACAVTGVFDVVASFSVADISDIGPLVVDKIHSVEGVVETQTAICVACHGENCD